MLTRACNWAAFVTGKGCVAALGLWQSVNANRCQVRPGQWNAGDAGPSMLSDWTKSCAPAPQPLTLGALTAAAPPVGAGRGYCRVEFRAIRGRVPGRGVRSIRIDVKT